MDNDGRVTHLESLAYGDAFFLFLCFRNLEGEQSVGVIFVGVRKLVIDDRIPDDGFRMVFGDQGCDLITNRREISEDPDVKGPLFYILRRAHLMKVTRFRRTGGEALSSHVDSSGQYTTYIFSTAPTDSETRQMYRPERRAGLSVLASGEAINFTELSGCQ